MTDKKKHTFSGDDDFLLNEDFIRWRLFRTEESNDYWNNFLSQYPEMEKGLKKSIAQFDTIKINRFNLSGKEKEEVYHTVLYDVKRYRKRRLFIWIGSAASIFLAGILFIVLFLHENRDAQQPTKWEKALIEGRRLPEEERYLISFRGKIDVAVRDISRESVDVSEFICWENGILVLKKRPLSEVLKQIERFYNVQFEGGSIVELGNLTYSGKLFIWECLDSVMTSVLRFSSTVYQREKNNIRIRKNKSLWNK